MLCVDSASWDKICRIVYRLQSSPLNNLYKSWTIPFGINFVSPFSLLSRQPSPSLSMWWNSSGINEVSVRIQTSYLQLPQPAETPLESKQANRQIIEDEDKCPRPESARSNLPNHQTTTNQSTGPGFWARLKMKLPCKNQQTNWNAGSSYRSMQKRLRLLFVVPVELKL